VSSFDLDSCFGLSINKIVLSIDLPLIYANGCTSKTPNSSLSLLTFPINLSKISKDDAINGPSFLAYHQVKSIFSASTAGFEMIIFEVDLQCF
jgi:hypothetical protein